LTQSRDEECRPDTATTLQGENFRPLQTAVMSTSTTTAAAAAKAARQSEQPAESDGTGGLQVVTHCTQDNFFVTVYDDEDLQ